MTIGRRLQLTAGVLILFVLGTGSLLFWSSRLVEYGIRGTDSTSQAVRSALMMTNLFEQHLLYGDKRTRTQWDKYRELFGQALDKMTNESIDRTLLTDLRHKYESLTAVSPQIMQIALTKSDDGRQDRRKRGILTSLMLLRLEELGNAANDLNRASAIMTLKRRHVVQNMIVAIGATLFCAILVNILLIRKSVVHPIQRLSVAAERIGEGNFDYKAESTGDDEVGKLVRAFNTMTGHLRDREADLRAAYNELQVKDERNRFLANVIRSSSQPFGVGHVDGSIQMTNKAYSDLLGYTEEEMLRADWAPGHTPSEYREFEASKLAELTATGKPVRYEKEYIRKDGTRVPVELLVHIDTRESGERYYYSFITDLTERKVAEQERGAAIEFLQLVNDCHGTEELIRAATSFFQEQSGCEAVGIRIHKGDDYPYFETRGFPEEFILLENHLCTYDENDRPSLDTDGHPILECMCGNVIRGLFDASKPCFTERGSFWTNCTTELLATTTEADGKARTRNRCNGEGYESRALIALGSGDEISGLLQLNDKRKGRFAPEKIALWERLCQYLSVALEKCKAEEAVQRNEALLRSVLDQMPSGVTARDARTGSLILSNGRALQMMGALVETPDQFAGYCGAYPDERKYRAEEWPVSRSMATGEVVDSEEIQFDRSDGSAITLSISSAPVRDSQGEIVMGVGVFHDITERKQAEAALKDSEERLRLFIEHAPAAISMFDTEMRYLAVSRRWLTDYRLSGPDILARSHYEIFPEIPDSWKAVHRRGLEGEVIRAEEDRFGRIEGGAQWLRWEVRPWHNSSGAIGGIIIFTEDITERKQAEEELRNAYQRLYGILSNLYGGLLLVSADGSIEFVNPALCEQFQLQMPPSALQGLTALEFIPLIRDVFDEPDRAVDRISEIVRDEQPVKDEEIAMGVGRTYLRDFIPIEIDGKPCGRLWHHRDITEIKRIETEIKALNEDLEKKVSERTADLAQSNQQLMDEREALRRASRALKAFSECSQALIEEQEESVLLDRICRVLVEMGEYRMVWVGYAIDDAAKTVRCVAHAGFDNGYLEAVKITWADEEAGRGPLGTAIRTGKPQVNRNTKDNPYYGLWRHEAIKRGYASSIGLPLSVNERVIGVLSLYASDPDAFDLEEVELLTRLASDISYGITAVRTRLEKEQAQEAFDRVHRRQELILKSAWEGIYGIDLEGHYTFMNPAAAHMLACEGEGLIGLRTRAICRSNMAEENSSEEGEIDIRSVLLAGVSLHIPEAVLRREDGTTFPVELAVTPVIETDKITGGVVTFWDITERKRAQQEILANIKEIEDLYHNAPCGYHSIDGEGFYVRINDTELSWLGYTKEEVIGKKRFQDFLSPESLKIFEESFPRSKERGWVKGMEYDLIRKDGSILPVLLSATALKDPSGNYIMSRSTMFDVTESKRADEELRLSEERFRLIAETVQDAFWVTSPGAKETCYFSPGFKRIWGRSPDELFQSGWDREALLGTIPPEDRSVVRNLRQLSDQGKPFEGEFRIIRSDGEVRWMHDRGLPVHDEKGNVKAMAGIMSDITGRKQMELALVRSNEDLQQFAYVASHDLQEPLRNVASCLQLLEKKYKDKLDALAFEYIHHAVDGAVRMKALILDLLQYSRVATKGKTPRQTDCEQVLAATLKNMRSAVAESGAEITHDQLPTVFVDESQLVQVFQNLIQNAIKFRRHDPPRVHVSAVKSENKWVFSVEDNGIGIESRHLKRVFVIFQRLHKRSQYDGTGMGLAIVKKVVERHGGRVWAESELGVGTAVYFTIPEKGLLT